MPKKQHFVFQFAGTGHWDGKCQEAVLFNLSAEIEQTSTSGWMALNVSVVEITMVSDRTKNYFFRRDEAGDAKTAPHCWKQSSTSVFAATWWFRGHRKWCWLSVPFVFLQKESVTWQWTRIRWQCPCRTPTPGRQPWTTWGCLPLGSLDSNSCQVLHWLNFTSPTRTTDSFVLKSYFNIKLAKIGIKASVFCFHPDVGDVWIFSH